ncbi:hypothetical protein SALBM311S_03281 [Streptomyces alboniger]
MFVAAEFSLTTLERGDLERAVEAGERGAEGALKAVRRLTVQLSGAQLGITVTSLVIGMLAEPSLAALLRGPLTGLGLGGAASSVASVLGVAVSTVVLMVVGELVPKNWAISRPLAVAKVVAGPQRGFTAAFGPFIGHLNNTANLFVRRFGLEPAEELASARGPEELVALARHSAAEGALEADSAELFVRTLHLVSLTAENVMTPRVDVKALEARATAADAANLTHATGLSRFRVSATAWTRSSAPSTSGTFSPWSRTSARSRGHTPRHRAPAGARHPARRPAAGAAASDAHHGDARHRRVRRYRGRGDHGGHRRGGRRRGPRRTRPPRTARPASRPRHG